VRNFTFFVRTEIAIKIDDHILNFRHFDFICQNYIKALNMTSIALELNHQKQSSQNLDSNTFEIF
jgi:hypothetical protein